MTNTTLNAFYNEMEKISGLYSLHKKLKKDAFIDPRDPDAASSVGLGPAVGIAVPGITSAALAGIGSLALKRRWPSLAVGFRKSILPILAGTALASSGLYWLGRNKGRKRQAKGLNPFTGRKFNPKKIEKTRRWAKGFLKHKGTAKGKAIQRQLNRQVLDEVGG